MTHASSNTPLRAKYGYKDSDRKIYAGNNVSKPIHLVQGKVEFSGHCRSK